MLVGFMCAGIMILMVQSDLFIVQWALSLAEGEHSLAQSPPFLSGPQLVQPWGYTEHKNTGTQLSLIDVLDKSHANPPHPLL